MKSSHERENRRDRRKAKASDFRRGGTVNPKKKGHHAYEAISTSFTKKRVKRQKSPVVLFRAVEPLTFGLNIPMDMLPSVIEKQVQKSSVLFQAVEPLTFGLNIPIDIL